MDPAENDIRLALALKEGDHVAFETVYLRMAGKLLNYFYTRIHDKERSEELVQDIFVSLWERRSKINIENSIEGYLYAAAKHQLLNHMRSESVRKKYADHLTLFIGSNYEQLEDLINVKDLERIIREHVAELPAQCQKAFSLSRFNGLPIGEIAEEMKVSKRTIENYITTALKHLRKALSNYPWVIISLLIQQLTCFLLFYANVCNFCISMSL